MLKHLDLGSSTYYIWLDRQDNKCLRDLKPVGRNPYRLLDWDKEVIRDFYLENQEKSLDDDEAFANQAMDYLAVNDVEMILLME